MSSGPLETEVNLIVEDGVVIDFDEARIRALVEFALIEAGASASWEVAVVLTTDARLRDLHRHFMGIDSETDVMTFPSEQSRGAAATSGDIIISVDRAAEQGSDYGLTPEEETEYLIVHGILHLCGWDDHEDADRARMLAYQDEIINRFDTYWGSDER